MFPEATPRPHPPLIVAGDFPYENHGDSPMASHGYWISRLADGDLQSALVCADGRAQPGVALPSDAVAGHAVLLKSCRFSGFPQGKWGFQAG